MTFWLQPPKRKRVKVSKKPKKKPLFVDRGIFRGRYAEYVERVKVYLEKIPPIPRPIVSRAHNSVSAAVAPECMCKWCRARRNPPLAMPEREPSFDPNKGEVYNHAKDTRDFDRHLQRQVKFLEPQVPRFPLIEWLAVQIYYWYGPSRWTVDLDAIDWLVQLREADGRNSFSMAECRAQAEKRGYVIPLLEEMMLQYITREPLFSIKTDV